MKTEPHERVISGVFNTRKEAHHALDALAPSGIEAENISLISSQSDFNIEEFSDIAGIHMHDETVHAVKIARIVGGVVAGATALVGMIFGHAALLPTALIVIAVSGFGALLGTVIAAGFTENEWDILDAAMRQGKVLLSVHTHGFAKSREVKRILNDCNAHIVHAF